MNPTLAPDAQELAIRLVVAVLGGLAVGIEREWSAKVRGRHHDFAGVRTFALLAGLGALGGLLAAGGQPLLGAAVVGGAAALSLAAYVYAAKSGDLDGTTEVAALLAMGAGVLAGLGQLALAAGTFAGVALLLVEKGRLHGMVARLRSEEIEAAFRFAVLALVVLPLLPTGPYGPAPGIEPRELWALVLLFSGLGFAGYVALRLAGPRRGFGFAGLFGGMISSTVVTLDFARQSRQSPEHAGALGLGVIAACCVLCVRVPLLAAALSVPFALALAKWLALPLAVGVLLSLRELLRSGPADGEAVTTGEVPGHRQPLRLAPAIRMTLLFVVVSFAVEWLGKLFGAQGLYGSAAVASLTDMDALTYSLAKTAGTSTPLALAVSAALFGVLVNTLFKLGLALALGHPRFRVVVSGGLLALAVATAVGIWLA